MQAARPQSVLSPSQFGVKNEMDNVFSSRWLVDELVTLRFSIASH
jgi:hypothetical protein